LLPRVSETAASPDGKEAFELTLFEPWVGAGRRVIVMTGASIGSTGMVSLSTFKSCESSDVPPLEVSLVGSR